MPPRTRTTKSTKSLKENIGVVQKINKRAIGKTTKQTRKALADKTNSASDDNTSVEFPKKVLEKPPPANKDTQLQPENEDPNRPRRDRRLPNRFVENEVLKNLSNNKENTPDASVSINDKTKTPSNNESTVSPFKTPQKPADTSLVAIRPRRVCRLPSRLEDHSISPNKFIPVQPAHASTPKVQKKNGVPKKGTKEIHNTTPRMEQRLSSNKKSKEKSAQKDKNKNISSETSTPQVKVSKTGTQDAKKVTPDTNNNAKGRILRARKKPATESKQSPQDKKQTKSPHKTLSKHTMSPVKTLSKQTKSPVKILIKPIKSPLKLLNKQTKNAVKPLGVNEAKRPINKSFSFKVLDDNENKGDVYEFTFDPNEEPPPQKKKKRVIKKRPAKPKTVVFKNNYDMNVNKALAALKTVVAKKQVNNAQDKVQNPVQNEPEKQASSVQQDKTASVNNNVRNIPMIQRNVASKIIISSVPPVKQNARPNNEVQANIVNGVTLVQSTNSARLPEQNKSIQIEDIAADFETSMPHHDINYSPVNSPCRPKTPTLPPSQISRVHDNDPLKLRENLSFFDENPVASSSMNSSVRHPHASPWRVEFESLPIKWHVNSYVKSNMTPAVECSFVNFEDKNKRKHVYTNLVPESNEALPEIVTKDQPNLIQTSIISFIREAMEKSSSKKKRGRSVTPVTATLFNDTTNKTPNKNVESTLKTTTGKASRQLFTPQKTEAALDTAVATTKDTSSEKENSRETSKGLKRKIDENLKNKQAKPPHQDKDNTYFGFDDSENQDQENISPKKNVEGHKRTLRSRARAALKEINEPTGPTRVVVPVAVKSARTAEVERMYEDLKSATDAPVFPEKESVNVGATNINEALDELLNEEDSQSVHLFEDIEVVHHVKPLRKSYGKAKKVAFRQLSSESNTVDKLHRKDDSDEDDDMKDLTFDPGVPFVEEIKKVKKKQTKKQKMTKKEEEEAEAWAANFNSMCEDVEEFPLLVE